MANPRTRARIEARILERAAYCVEFELNDPRAAFITVTQVEISDDLSHAKVFYTVLGSDADKSRCKHMLADATGYTRRRIGTVLRTRRTPQISWIYDNSMEIQEDMERRIAAALQHDRALNPQAHDAPEAAPAQGERARTEEPDPQGPG